MVWNNSCQNSITSTSFVHSNASCTSTALRILGCLTLDEWPYHRGYPGLWGLFVFLRSFLCIFAISSWSPLLLLALNSFFPLLCPSLHEIFLCYLQLLEEISILSPSFVSLCFFALFIEEGFLSLLDILWNSAFNQVHLVPFPFSLAFHFSSFLSYLWRLPTQPLS